MQKIWSNAKLQEMVLIESDGGIRLYCPERSREEYGATLGGLLLGLLPLLTTLAVSIRSVLQPIPRGTIPRGFPNLPELIKNREFWSFADRMRSE
jgi:hypothetical protein